MAKRAKGESKRDVHDGVPVRPTRTFDQLATDLVIAIQQARDMVEAMAINTPPPRHVLSWLYSVFTDYRLQLKCRLDTLVAEDEEPSELFPVYDKHLGTLLGLLNSMNMNEYVDQKVVQVMRVFLQDLPSETLLFN
ncbi:MAG TPA: hypothetical protein VKM55_14365 [Candidatus Lokiarchaeia archaeon]|nr:hypothetical protein [Candidatus Lokiarchaeia archaeon]